MSWCDAQSALQGSEGVVRVHRCMEWHEIRWNEDGINKFCPPTITGRHSSTGLHIVGVQVNLGPADRVPYLYYEAAKTTVAEAEQTASLMAIHALAAERQDVNYPQVQHLRHQVACLHGRGGG
uniref:Uncharacterized protein n=1 Tax=Oryza barthii TaxID=65489 RepID=A0A0D3GG72_9ORYZ